MLSQMRLRLMRPGLASVQLGRWSPSRRSPPIQTAQGFVRHLAWTRAYCNKLRSMG